VLRPRLATSWTPSQGGKVWTVKLRQGVKFHNGQLMTADDVVATFKRLVDKKSGSSALASFSFLPKEGIKKVDQHTVSFTLSRVVVDFPAYLNTYQAVILPANWPGNFAKHPWGTGAFKLTGYVPGQRVTYVKNPDYWISGLPYLDGVEIVSLSLDGAVQAILGGSVDMGGNSASLPVLRANPHIKMLTVPSATHYGIFMRTDKAPYNDKRVRQALAYGLNRPDIIKSVAQGLAVLGDDNVIAPSYSLYSPIPQRAQDYAKAKALLSAAGHPNGFSATLVTTSDTAFLVPLATVAKEMWKPLGVNITIKPEPASVYYNTDWLQTPLNATDWGNRATPSQFLDTAYITNAVWNASHWSDPAFDSLVKQLDSELDFTKRKAIARQIELVETDQTPSIITFFVKSATFVRTNVQGYVPDAIGFTDLRRTYLSS
jgi:peptide/nickel transport system substrate-binding protein